VVCTGSREEVVLADGRGMDRRSIPSRCHVAVANIDRAAAGDEDRASACVAHIRALLCFAFACSFRRSNQTHIRFDVLREHELKSETFFF
jgi:hypothetical protein